ncbi:MAG: hypothetical protein VB130_08550 [Clostridium sp.]|nr:hypothetical protein [Clostridium sp.]
MNLGKFNININENTSKKNIIIAALVVICLIFVIVFLATRSSRIQKYNQNVEKKSYEYFLAGEYDKAIEQYNKIKLDNSKDNRIVAFKNINIAEAYLLKGDKVNYKKYIDLAKEAKSKNDEVLNRIVFNDFINGDIEEALKYGQEALKSNSKNKALIKTMIAVDMANGKIDDARNLAKSYAVDKNSSYDVAEYAGILMALGDFTDGFNQLKIAFNMDKDEYKIYDILAQESVYNKPEVINYIKELEKQNPQEIAYKMWLAKVYSLDPATSKDAEKLITELENKDAGKIEIKLIKAAVLQNTNKNEEADKIINEVIQQNKNDYRVFHTAGWLYLKKNDLNKAMEYCKESIENNKEYPDNYAFLMPEILKSMEKTESIESYYRIGIMREPYNYNIMLNAANYYWYTAQKPEEALTYFKLASKIKPNEPEIKYNVALLLFNKGKDKEAVQALKECIKLDNKSIKYHRTLGTIYLNMGNPKDGMNEIKTAFKYDENDILTLNNAGCYYIIYTSDFHRGYYNLKKALAGINKNTDEYTKKVINENYNKVKAIIDQIEKGKGNESIKVPDFRLLY